MANYSYVPPAAGALDTSFIILILLVHANYIWTAIIIIASVSFVFAHSSGSNVNLMLIYVYYPTGSEIVKCNLISKNLVCMMWFSTKSCNAVVQPQVLIDETPLSQVDRQKYLGVVFDSKLTWSSHACSHSL